MAYYENCEGSSYYSRAKPTEGLWQAPHNVILEENYLKISYFVDKELSVFEGEKSGGVYEVYCEEADSYAELKLYKKKKPYFLKGKFEEDGRRGTWQINLNKPKKLNYANFLKPGSIEKRDALDGEYIFKRDANNWIVKFREQNESAKLPDIDGMHYIAYLLEHPHKEYLSSSFYKKIIGIQSSETTISEYDAMNDLQLEKENLCDVDEKKEPDYFSTRLQKRKLEKLLQFLKDKLSEAEYENNMDATHILEGQIEEIDRQLRADYDINGNPREFSTEAEKKRTCIRKAIDKALEKMGKEAPCLKEYLKNNIQCDRKHWSYWPEHKSIIEWNL